MSRWLVPLGVLASTAFLAAFFYPGYLTGDSNVQYAQVLSGHYSDWHPVLLPFLWRYLDAIVAGSGGLFLATLLVFFTGLALVVRDFSQGPASFVGPMAFLTLWPPLFAMLTQVGKDALMGAALLLGFALLWRAHRRASLGLWLAALAFLWLGLSMRHNAAAAAFPLVVWAGFLLARDHLPRGWRGALAGAGRRTALGLALFAALYGSSQAAQAAILGRDGIRAHLYQLILVYDLVGISVRTGESQLPRFYWSKDGPYEVAELRQLYNPQTNFFLHWGEPPPYRLGTDLNDHQLAELRRAWLRAVLDHPAAYLDHRAGLFLAQLGVLPGSPIHSIGFNKVSYHYVGPTVFDWPPSAWLTDFLWHERATIIFRPWVYLALSLACTAYAWRRRSPNRLPINLLGASSAAYLLPYALVGVAADYRYVWWCIVVALLQTVMVFDGLGREAPEPVGATRSGQGR